MLVSIFQFAAMVVWSLNLHWGYEWRWLLMILDKERKLTEIFIFSLLCGVSNLCISLFLSFVPVGRCFRGWSKINLKVYDIINFLNKSLITHILLDILRRKKEIRGRSRAAATSKMERFQPLTIITKLSTLDVAAALDPSLEMTLNICQLIEY